jgi:hypothetical protein
MGLQGARLQRGVRTSGLLKIIKADVDRLPFSAG